MLYNLTYLEALKHYHKLVQEHDRAKKAYTIDPSQEKWERLQESITALRKQDDIIRFHRWLDGGFSK